MRACAVTDQKHLKLLIDFLNLKEDSSFYSAKRILRDSMLCRYILSFSESNMKFSLLTREEVAKVEDGRDTSGYSLNRLRSEMASVDESITRTLLSKIATMKESIIFPEDINTETGLSGRDLFIQELFKAVKWFHAFMAGCESGRMDIGTLNEFKYTKGIVLEFKPSKNPMNPALSAAELLDVGDDIIERKLLCNFIYPFLFSGQGNLLSKIRRCRNCGAYFPAKRVSATFCGSKCRSAFYYENSH
jgi:hypothetical protein